MIKDVIQKGIVRSEITYAWDGGEKWNLRSENDIETKVFEINSGKFEGKNKKSSVFVDSESQFAFFLSNM